MTYHNSIVEHRDSFVELICADICKIRLPNKKVDLVVTSPPYNVGMEYSHHDDTLSYNQYLKFNKKWLKCCYRWLRHTGRLCLNIPLDKNKGGQQSVGADLTCIAKEIGFRYHSTIIWNEGSISRRTAWGSWKSASAPYVIAPVELILVLYKGEWKRESGIGRISTIERDEFIQWTNGLWTFKGESPKRVGHPAPFPIELPRRCIKMFSFEGDTIMDPFMGSGTTGVACMDLKRKFIGIDLDVKYFEIAKSRICQTQRNLF